MRFQKYLTIKVPEGVEFSMPIADPLSRALAVLVDFGVKVMLVIAVEGVLRLISLLFSDLAAAFSLVISFSVFVMYPVFFEWYWRGQTPGKRMLKLRVVDANGLNLSFSQVFVRNLLRLADMLPGGYMLGGLFALLTKKGQRLGDIAAGTVVVSQRRISMPDIELLKPAQYNSLRDYAYISARLRQLTSPDEALLLANAVLRRAELEPAARLKVFRELRAYFEKKARYPEELTLGMSDERYLNNIADIFFQ